MCIRDSLGTAAVWARAVPAGTIASRNGSPSVTPAAFRTARREICFFVMNICFPFGTAERCRSLCSLRTLLTKRVAVGDSQHDRRQLVVVFRGSANDGTNLRHIEIFQPAVD